MSLQQNNRPKVQTQQHNHRKHRLNSTSIRNFSQEKKSASAGFFNMQVLHIDVQQETKWAEKPKYYLDSETWIQKLFRWIPCNFFPEVHLNVLLNHTSIRISLPQVDEGAIKLRLTHRMVPLNPAIVGSSATVPGKVSKSTWPYDMHQGRNPTWSTLPIVPFTKT